MSAWHYFFLYKKKETQTQSRTLKHFRRYRIRFDIFCLAIYTVCFHFIPHVSSTIRSGRFPKRLALGGTVNGSGCLSSACKEQLCGVSHVTRTRFQGLCDPFGSHFSLDRPKSMTGGRFPALDASNALPCTRRVSCNAARLLACLCQVRGRAVRVPGSRDLPRSRPEVRSQSSLGRLPACGDTPF